ncbi:hypothetical protein [Bradyrhizobium sp. Ai1a-2]|uniref:hypothetical protein n=1 Tax=Bradyrhizobium sp. Ai1a-2 TaxID=196490 RepID=UPI001363D12F|nr:hypothetical protein [Bradyrhizobium sp. Ai1a-2]
MTLAKTSAITSVTGGVLSNLANADTLNADNRSKPIWGPTLVVMSLILAPFIWHEWLMVLDSCPMLWGLGWWGSIPYPELIHHRIGSWGVPSIGKPGPDGQSAWDRTEQAIFTSFFAGASTAVAAVAAIRAIKK